MSRYAWLVIFTALLFPVSATWAQDLNGSFTANGTGENFDVQSNADGSAEIYGSNGRHVGTAQDNGDGTWDITSDRGYNLGQIQDNGNGSFDVYGSRGGYWGSGESDQ